MKPIRRWIRNPKPSVIWDGIPVYGYTPGLLTAATTIGQQYRPCVPDFESVVQAAEYCRVVDD